MARKAVVRVGNAADKSADRADAARQKLATARSGFTAQDGLDIAERKADRDDSVRSVYLADVANASAQLDTVRAQLDQAMREAALLGATQADMDKARHAGKPKSRR
jgi:hypothetical protein